MLQLERQQMILDYLENKTAASVKELAKVLYISEASIRRDITELESKGLVERTYGGVLLARYKNEVIPVELRDSESSAAKERIAMEAARLIQDGDTIIMDASTTVSRICHYMKGMKNVRVFTNNLRIFTLLQASDIEVYCTGGKFFPQRECFLGPYAEDFLHTVSADILFFSSQGISEDGDITDVDEQENSLRRVMIKQARKKIFLCDSSKFGVRRPFILCNREQVDRIISDKRLAFQDPAR